MKKFLLLAAILVYMASTGMAQPPGAFKYQAVARDAQGDIIRNTDLPVRISLRYDNPQGEIVWQETHNVKTNDFGLINLEIGRGTSTGVGSAASFDEIDWSKGAYFISVDLDFGSGFTNMGISELLSVPYALYAAKAASSAGAQTLSLQGNELSISNGNSVTLPIKWKSQGNNIYFKGGTASIGTKYNYSQNTALNVTDSTNKNIPALIYAYTTGSDNFFVTSRTTLSTIEGTTGTNQAMAALSTGTSTGTNTGLYAYAECALENYAVHAEVKGNTDADSNYAVYGISYGDASTGGFNVGVHGQAKGSSYFNVGVNGLTEGVANSNYGVFGTSRGAGSGLNIGVDGFASSSNLANYGVYGDISGGGSVPWNIAVFADAQKSTATNTYAVYARVASGSGKTAGYFDGNVTVTGTFSNPSDAFLKTQVNDLSNALSIVKNLKPVSFQFKPELEEKGFNFPQGTQFGFIAQDVEKILPQLVMDQYAPVFKEDGNATRIERFEYKSVNYLGFIPILTSAIQDQQKLIEKQAEKIQSLEKEIQYLKTAIQELQKK